jgi:hypothetical protein
VTHSIVCVFVCDSKHCLCVCVWLTALSVCLCVTHSIVCVFVWLTALSVCLCVTQSIVCVFVCDSQHCLWLKASSVCVSICACVWSIVCNVRLLTLICYPHLFWHFNFISRFVLLTVIKRSVMQVHPPWLPAYNSLVSHIFSFLICSCDSGQVLRRGLVAFIQFPDLSDLFLFDLLLWPRTSSTTWTCRLYTIQLWMDISARLVTVTNAHTHTHTHAHALTHAHTHARTHAHTYTSARSAYDRLDDERDK